MVDRVRAILVIEDESQTRRVVANALRQFSERVIEAATGAAGIDHAAAERPDLIVLDLGLPDLQGLEVCREVRTWTRAPIIVLSARDADDDKVALLMAGADDYLTKPFSLREFLARVEVQLRRKVLHSNAVPDEVPAPIEADGIRIDFREHSVRRHGKMVHLTRTEWMILTTVAAQPGRMLTHKQIFEAVWGRQFGNASQHLRVHILHLRRKIEPDPSYPTLILTEAGVGYRFVSPAP